MAGVSGRAARVWELTTARQFCDCLTTLACSTCGFTQIHPLERKNLGTMISPEIVLRKWTNFSETKPCYSGSCHE
eukprot:1392353-Amorphochlora_amoeboformis.AAC.1